MPSSNKGSKLLLFTYCLLMVYGTWFPLADWDWSLGGFATFLSMDIWEKTTPFDVAINLVMYLPFGFLVTHLLPASLPRRLLITTLLGGLVCGGLELGQTYLPARVTSLSDIVLNTTGTLLGAMGAAAFNHRRTLYWPPNCWRPSYWRLRHCKNAGVPATLEPVVEKPAQKTLRLAQS